MNTTMSLQPVPLMRLLGLLFMTWLLAGCGWQLQGMHRVPEYVTPLYLDLTDIHSPFAEALQQRLMRAGVAVTDDRTKAQATLRVSIDNSSHRVSSVSAFNEPQQYEVFYDVEYSLESHTPGIATLLPKQKVGATRTMSYDKTLALAKEREEKFLRTTLADDLADQLMRRLSLLPKEPVAAAQVLVAP